MHPPTEEGAFRVTGGARGKMPQCPRVTCRRKGAKSQVSPSGAELRPRSPFGIHYRLIPFKFSSPGFVHIHCVCDRAGNYPSKGTLGRHQRRCSLAPLSRLSSTDETHIEKLQPKNKTPGLLNLSPSGWRAAAALHSNSDTFPTRDLGLQILPPSAIRARHCSAFTGAKTGSRFFAVVVLFVFLQQIALTSCLPSPWMCHLHDRAQTCKTMTPWCSAGEG